jgi:hypothetical protein
MLLSDGETKNRWCPFGRGLVEVRHSVGGAPVQISSCNRSAKGTPTVACIGSTCMAWRWAGWRIRNYDTIAPDPHDDNKVGARLGYCGLAGKPHGAP